MKEISAETINVSFDADPNSISILESNNHRFLDKYMLHLTRKNYKKLILIGNTNKVDTGG